MSQKMNDALADEMFRIETGVSRSGADWWETTGQWRYSFLRRAS